jgi:hypothetical protein
LGNTVNIVGGNWWLVKAGKQYQALHMKYVVVADSDDTREKSLLRFHANKSGLAGAAKLFRPADIAGLVCD